MKTLELELKKKVLIVDLEDDEAGFINGNYDFLCDGSELTEEMASELAFDVLNISENKKVYVDHCDEYNCFESAIKSVISYVIIEGFHWLENPIKIIERGEDTEHNRVLNQNEWQEAEEKTFKNPLIFIKNYVQ